MKDFIPLFQTGLWIILVLTLICIFRSEIALLRNALAKRLEGGSSFEFGPVRIGELRTEINSVRKGLDETNEKVAHLFLTTMAPAMYENLKKIASGHFGQYQMSQGLRRELYHLRDIGYIEVPSVGAIPDGGEDLSVHAKITPVGRQFVDLREALLSTSKPVERGTELKA
jgi:hypothetical protein